MKSKRLKLGLALSLLTASAWTLAASLHVDICCDDPPGGCIEMWSR